jgi:hypothetical protein
MIVAMAKERLSVRRVSRSVQQLDQPHRQENIDYCLPDEPQTLKLIAYAIVNTSTNSIDSEEPQQLLHELFVHGKH